MGDRYTEQHITARNKEIYTPPPLCARGGTRPDPPSHPVTQRVGRWNGTERGNHNPLPLCTYRPMGHHGQPATKSGWCRRVFRPYPWVNPNKSAGLHGLQQLKWGLKRGKFVHLEVEPSESGVNMGWDDARLSIPWAGNMVWTPSTLFANGSSHGVRDHFWKTSF